MNFRSSSDVPERKYFSKMNSNTFITDRDILMSHYAQSLANTVHFSTPSERHSKAGPADLWEMKRDFQISFLRNIGLKPEHQLMDFGCGTLRGGLPLIQYLDTGNYSGIEVRQEVLDEGILELNESGLKHKAPRLECVTDLSQHELGVRYDVIWAFSVLIHLEDNILREVLDFVSRHLSEKGVFYANVNVGTQPDGSWQGFPVVYRNFDFYKAAFERNNMTVSDLGYLQEFGHFHPRLSQEAQEYQRMLCAVRR